MAALPISILTILLALYSLELSAVALTPLGGWNPIKDLTDPAVVRVANFAVAEHNRQSNDLELKFERIIRGEIQVVDGLNYKLVIAGQYIKKTEPDNFEAVVYQKAGQKALELVSFKKVPPQI